MDVFTNKIKALRVKLDTVPAFHKAEEATKVPKEYLGVGCGVLFLVFILYGVGIATLCGLVGFAYPAFKTFQAIEYKSDIVQWQVYWIIFSLFAIMEVFVDIILYWIPFYFAFKLAFLLWLMLPQTKGATFMYEVLLRDFLKKKSESKIDSAIRDAKKQANFIATDFTGSYGPKDE